MAPTVTRLQLHDVLDNLYDELVRAQAQARQTLGTLAEAARVLPLVAAGFEPLMLLEADFTGRLALLEAVRVEVDGVSDETDMTALRQHIAYLGIPGLLSAPPVASSALN